ncbi:MAG: MGMT family protein [Peptococcaceae bacterium]|nr:MGMT family protein [Peptococcaceae bacterium]
MTAQAGQNIALEFQEKVYQIVGDIPSGRVLTYGAIALLAGNPRNPRQVGKLLARAPGDLPAHRVVNHAGRTVPGWPEQRVYLTREGVAFKSNGCVDLRRHLWRVWEPAPSDHGGGGGNNM